jgi:hypothetical protein
MYPVLTDPNLREFLQLDDGIQLALEAECRTAGAAAVSAHIGAWVRACMRPFPSRANGLSTREGGTGAPPHVPSAVTDRVCVRVLQRSALPPTAAAAPCTPCRHRPGAPPDCAPSLKARPASPMWCWRRCWLLAAGQSAPVALWPCGLSDLPRQQPISEDDGLSVPTARSPHTVDTLPAARKLAPRGAQLVDFYCPGGIEPPLWRCYGRRSGSGSAAAPPRRGSTVERATAAPAPASAAAAGWGKVGEVADGGARGAEGAGGLGCCQAALVAGALMATAAAAAAAAHNHHRGVELSQLPAVPPGLQLGLDSFRQALTAAWTMVLTK